MWSSRLLPMIVLGAAVVLLAFLAVLTGSWWGVVGAMALLQAMVFVVVRNVLSGRARRRRGCATPTTA